MSSAEARPLVLVEDPCLPRRLARAQGVSFRVPEGGVTALLGRNGVGKTTTLQAIMGLVPSNGRANLGGEDISQEPTHRIVQRGVGYVPEDRDVFAGLWRRTSGLAERNGSALRARLRPLPRAEAAGAAARWHAARAVSQIVATPAHC